MSNFTNLNRPVNLHYIKVPKSFSLLPPAWEENKYYKWVEESSSYVLLTSKPSDWNTLWTNYFVCTEDWRYTEINQSKNFIDPRLNRLSDVILTESTINKRVSLQQRLDEFCTFSWNGINAFDTFGAFITNKNSLKFYNGPNFSNEYSSPMYTDAASNLTGVKFSTQKISFTVGVYWISEEHYRRFIYWLNPYEIGPLVFDFAPMWNYQVKLTGRKDTTRYIIGHEGYHLIFDPANPNAPKKIEEDTVMYYTEIALDFELQGDPCATYNIPYTFSANKEDTIASTESIWKKNEVNMLTESDDTYLSYTTYLPKINSETTGNIASDLSASFEVTLPFLLKVRDNVEKDYKYWEIHNMEDENLVINLYAQLTVGNEIEEVQLFNLVLNNLSYIFEQGDELASTLYVTYNSKDGLLFLRFGNEVEKLLTQLQTIANGERIVVTNKVVQFQMPGTFDYPSFDFNNFSLKLEVSGEILHIVDTDNFFLNPESNADTILMYATTNLI